ncbi:MAG: tetratricopeptide repeat protein [Pyrinomonadaceae bacterium]|nr:tetratricopeptide repeat protein [Pyrinomonadaceae bacterium]
MVPGPPKLRDEELRVLLETGFILREASRFDDAEAVFRGCMELIPDSEVPVVGLGTVYLQKGEYEKGLEYCRKAAQEHSGSAYARLHFGEALLFNNQVEEAQAQLLSVIEENHDSTYARTASRILAVADLQ